MLEGETKFKNKYRIPSARLQGYDYSQIGLYFVTICTKNRFPYFGIIKNGEMQLSKIGTTAYNCWLEIPNHFPHVSLDEFVIMPNHIHGIICIFVETHNYASLPEAMNYRNTFGPQSKNLSSIIRGFKIGVQKWATMNKIDFDWQSRFYDHVIRTEKSLEMIRNYIRKNPETWLEDQLYIPS